MRLIIFLLITVPLFAGLPFLYGFLRRLHETTARQRTGALDPRAKSIRDNHARMARWLDHVLADEMIYPVIPEDRRQKGRDLLASYYEEGATK